MRSLLFLAAAVAVSTPTAALAQAIEGRVGKLESEMRAVQRKVFPEGAGRLVLPDIEPQRQGGEPVTGVPASSAVADLTARVSTLEQQLTVMTGQIEQNQYRLRQADDAFAAYRRATDARLRTLEAGPAQPSAPVAAPDEDEPPRASAGRPSATATTRPAAATTTRSGTDDAGEDAYMAGYALWEAKRYADAERALKDAVAKHPRHRRASYAQNLLGRTYLDSGKPSLASIAFYDNYKKMPDGERAPQSLYYLAQALMVLKKPADACKVYGELSDVYAAKIGAQLKADITKGRAAAKCTA